MSVTAQVALEGAPQDFVVYVSEAAATAERARRFRGGAREALMGSLWDGWTTLLKDAAAATAAAAAAAAGGSGSGGGGGAFGATAPLIPPERLEHVRRVAESHPTPTMFDVALLAVRRALLAGRAGGPHTGRAGDAALSLLLSDAAVLLLSHGSRTSTRQSDDASDPDEPGGQMLASDAQKLALCPPFDAVVPPFLLPVYPAFFTNTTQSRVLVIVSWGALMKATSEHRLRLKTLVQNQSVRRRRGAQAQRLHQSRHDAGAPAAAATGVTSPRRASASAHDAAGCASPTRAGAAAGPEAPARPLFNDDGCGASASGAAEGKLHPEQRAAATDAPFTATSSAAKQPSTKSARDEQLSRAASRNEPAPPQQQRHYKGVLMPRPINPAAVTSQMIHDTVKHASLQARLTYIPLRGAMAQCIPGIPSNLLVLVNSDMVTLPTFAGRLVCCGALVCLEASFPTQMRALREAAAAAAAKPAAADGGSGGRPLGPQVVPARCPVCHEDSLDLAVDAVRAVEHDREVRRFVAQYLHKKEVEDAHKRAVQLTRSGNRGLSIAAQGVAAHHHHHHQHQHQHQHQHHRQQQATHLQQQPQQQQQHTGIQKGGVPQVGTAGGYAIPPVAATSIAGADASRAMYHQMMVATYGVDAIGGSYGTTAGLHRTAVVGRPPTGGAGSAPHMQRSQQAPAPAVASTASAAEVSTAHPRPTDAVVAADSCGQTGGDPQRPKDPAQDPQPQPQPQQPPAPGGFRLIPKAVSSAAKRKRSDK